MKPTREQWQKAIIEHLEHLPEEYGNQCNDHTRLMAIQELLWQKGILDNRLIIEKEWQRDGFIVPRWYEDYENEEIMTLCQFKKDWE